jgi:hypothetical protein
MARLSLSLLLLLPLLALSACGSGDGDRESTASGLYSDHAKSLAKAKAEAEALLGRDGSKLRAAWDKRRGSAAWNSLVLREIHSRKEAFEAARDLEDFCPAYHSATDFEKDSCWLRIVSAMARFESGFRPGATYLEDSGTTSVGLLMMNPAHCPGARTAAHLKNPAANIRCAMARMALLIARDRNLSGPVEERGAAAYWSVLRPPYRYKNLFLGRKPHIQEFTRTYRGFREERKRFLWGLIPNRDTGSSSEERKSP